MKFDFSTLPFRTRAFNEDPMKFVPAEPKSFLSAMIDLIMIETGKRKARENWQKAQLRNLLRHAHERSSFWRKRIGAKAIRHIELSDLPILTRSDVSHQAKSEGPLLYQSDGLKVSSHSTSGSSGTPVEFFISDMNEHYYQVRSIAQYFMEGRDLSLNRIRFKSLDYTKAKGLHGHLNNGFIVEQTASWLSSLDGLLKSGFNKNINCWHPNREALLVELAKSSIGYLVIQPRILETIVQNNDVGFLKNHHTEMLIPVGEELSLELRGTFAKHGIPVRGSYSSEEVGLIGCECEQYPSHYHVAHSNVIVEADRNDGVTVKANKLSRILVTHLHSYATPFIRYDVGDLGTLTGDCKCGHDGPTIFNIVGRAKHLIKHVDGRLTSIYIRAKDILGVADVAEYRVRQTALNTIVLENAGCDKLTADQHSAFVDSLKNQAGPDFTIDVRTVEEIDWGQSMKRLGFRNELL
jgi:phenylacetate-CoA ligase